MAEQRNDDEKKQVDSFDAPYVERYDQLVEQILRSEAIGDDQHNPLSSILTQSKEQGDPIEKAGVEEVLKDFKAQFDDNEYFIGIKDCLDEIDVMYDEEKNHHYIGYRDDARYQFKLSKPGDYDPLERLFIPYIFDCEEVVIEAGCILELNGLPFACKKLSIERCRIDYLPFLPPGLEDLVLNKTYVEKLQDPLPKHLLKLDCSDNCLTDIPELPQTVKILRCDANKIKKLPEMPGELVEISFGSAELEHLPDVPDTVLRYAIYFAEQIDTIPELPSRLETFICHHTPITEVPLLPETLDELYLWQTKIKQLPEKLPKNLIQLTICLSELESLPELPEELVVLDCGENFIKELPALPSSLEILHCRENNLTSLPPLPDGLTDIDCSQNFIVDLPEIPASVTHADFRENPLSEAAKAICEQRGFLYD